MQTFEFITDNQLNSVQGDFYRDKNYIYFIGSSGLQKIPRVSANLNYYPKDKTITIRVDNRLYLSTEQDFFEISNVDIATFKVLTSKSLTLAKDKNGIHILRGRNFSLLPNINPEKFKILQDDEQTFIAKDNKTVFSFEKNNLVTPGLNSRTVKIVDVSYPYLVVKDNKKVLFRNNKGNLVQLGGVDAQSFKKVNAFGLFSDAHQEWIYEKGEMRTGPLKISF